MNQEINSHINESLIALNHGLGIMTEGAALLPGLMQRFVGTINELAMYCQSLETQLEELKQKQKDNSEKAEA